MPKQMPLSEYLSISAKYNDSVDNLKISAAPKASAAGGLFRSLSSSTGSQRECQSPPRLPRLSGELQREGYPALSLVQLPRRNLQLYCTGLPPNTILDGPVPDGLEFFNSALKFFERTSFLDRKVEVKFQENLVKALNHTSPTVGLTSVNHTRNSARTRVFESWIEVETFWKVLVVFSFQLFV
jgi:hypothetical protein